MAGTDGDNTTTCTVEEAVALLLKHFGRLHRARERLDTAIRTNDARLLCGDNVVNPDFFASDLRIAIAPDGRGEIRATRSLEPGPHDWRLVRRDIEDLVASPSPLMPIEIEVSSPSPPSPPPPPVQESARTTPPLSSSSPQESTPIALLVEAALAAPPAPEPTAEPVPKSEPKSEPKLERELPKPGPLTQEQFAALSPEQAATLPAKVWIKHARIKWPQREKEGNSAYANRLMRDHAPADRRWKSLKAILNELRPEKPRQR